MLYTGEVIIFVPCATHGHKMIHEQMKHVSNEIVKIERIEFAFWDLIFLIFNFLFYTLDLYVWKNNDRIIDFCCFKLFDGTV